MPLRDSVSRRSFLAIATAIAGVSGQSPSAAGLTEVDRKNIAAVKGMSAAWKTGDAAKIASFMTDDCTFRGSAHDLARPPLVGAKEFATRFADVLKAQTIEMQIRDLFALDPLVVTSHYQLFESSAQGSRDDLFIGVFLMTNGKIQQWNDYGIILPRARTALLPANEGKFYRE